MENKKIEFFNRLSFVTLLVTFFISLFGFLPFSSITLDDTKGFIFSVGIVLSFFFWLISRLGEGKFILPKERFIFITALIPISFLISSFFSSSMRLSIFGNGFEVGTVSSMFIMFLLFFLSIIYFKTEKRLWYFIGSIFLGALIISIFQIVNIVVILFNSPFATFIQSTFAGNLIGSWNNFAIFFGLIALLSLFTLEFFKSTKIFLIIQYFLLIISLIFLAFINVSFVWILVGILSIIIFVYRISSQYSESNTPQTVNIKKKFPFKAFVVVLLSFIFLVANNSIGNILSRYVNFSNSEVRPSISATSNIALSSIKHNPFFGTGPNTFSSDWSLWQPKEIVQTIFWNIDFSNGFSTLTTFIITTGIIGLIAWILFFFFYIIKIIQSLKLASKDPLLNYFIFFILITSIYSWIVFIFYVPNILTSIFAFISTGIIVGILVNKKVIETKEYNFLSDPRRSFFTIFFLMFLIIFTLYTTYLYIEKFVSINYFYTGLNSDNNTVESISNSEKMLRNAVSLNDNDNYYRVLSQIYVNQINVLVNNNKLSPDVLKSNLQQLVNLSINSASLAIKYNPKQYLNYMNIGNIYASFIPLSIEGSYDNSINFYKKAQELYPNNPSILLAIAQLEIVNKNNNEARKYIQQALDIKFNYTDALLLLSQIEKEEGNISSAIKQIQNANDLNPNDTNILFRLGLLRYNNSDYEGAIGSFEQAVLINNNYLNARYFLGKSYQKVGRKDEAMVQFNILNSIIPDNKDVKDAIESISKPEVAPIEDVPVDLKKINTKNKN